MYKDVDKMTIEQLKAELKSLDDKDAPAEKPGEFDRLSVDVKRQDYYVRMSDIRKELKKRGVEVI